MSTLKDQIVARAEHVFDQHGFSGSGMDRLTQAAEVSIRTLYKHVGNKNSLIAAALKLRSEKFFNSITPSTVDELFADLEQWVHTEGARGCLFLRAQGEGMDAIPEVALMIDHYRQQLRELVAKVVHSDAGGQSSSELTSQVLVLFEGATAAAPYLGVQAVASARSAARTLLNSARA